MPAPIPQVAVVIATRNRGPELLGTLTQLRGLPERPPIVVVDNASTDGTAELVRAHHPDVQVVGLRGNRGAAGRTAVRGLEPLDAVAAVQRQRGRRGAVPQQHRLAAVAVAAAGLCPSKK